MTEERDQRRLAAIMVADVVGYSRLMQQDEAATVAALKARRSEVLLPVVSRHRGRIVKLMGDGVLIEFSSAVDAVDCAVQLQEAMNVANADLSEDRRIVLRVGVSLGDVIVEGSDLYGDGVNIAARLEALADPGGILISSTAHEHVRHKVKIGFDDLGPQHLKNIAEPVHAYRVTGVPRVALAAAKPITDKPSIAVLPFNNMSGDPEQQYFSDGITEDIITEISRFRELFVIARNSSFRYRDGATDVKRIGRELGADYLVEGSVRRSGGRVRVTAQLIEAASGNHVWAERYDRDLESVFTVQDEVVATIVTTLIGRLAAGGAERVRRKAPQLWAAYDYFLQGREQCQRYDAEAAAPLLRRAIELDPTYAQACGWLAIADYVLYAAHGRSADLNEGLLLAQKAVALEPFDSGSHRALGMILSMLRQYDLAGVHYDRAVALNPNDVIASMLRGLWLTYMGRGEEALRSLDADFRHDPFPPTWYWELRGLALFQTRRYTDAIEAYQRMDLRYWWTHCYVAACHAYLGQTESAHHEIASALALKSDISVQDLERAEYWRDPADLEHLKHGVLKAGLQV